MTTADVLRARCAHPNAVPGKVTANTFTCPDCGAVFQGRACARPTYEDLANVRAAIQVYARTMPEGDPFRASIERVEGWLKVEADRSLEAECKRELEGR